MLREDERAHEEAVVDDVTDRLDRDFANISRESINALVVAALHSYDTATVRTYVALLVERDVRRALKTLQGNNL